MGLFLSKGLEEPGLGKSNVKKRRSVTFLCTSYIRFAASVSVDDGRRMTKCKTDLN